MTQNYHTPVVLKAAANAATFNAPLSELDSQISTATTDLAAVDAIVDDILLGDQALELLLLTEISTPATPSSGSAKLYAKTDSNPWLLNSAGDDGLLLPKRAHHFHADSTVENGNAIALSIGSAQIHCYWAKQNTPADGDIFTFGALLAAGTYTLTIRGVKNNASGILDWTVDGAALITGQDWYNGSTVYNQSQASAAFDVSAGWHVFQATVNSKNGSSSSYEINLTDMAIKQASD